MYNKKRNAPITAVSNPFPPTLSMMALSLLSYNSVVLDKEQPQLGYIMISMHNMVA